MNFLKYKSGILLTVIIIFSTNVFCKTKVLYWEKSSSGAIQNFILTAGFSNSSKAKLFECLAGGKTLKKTGTLNNIGGQRHIKWSG